jgi:hypothetical protein
MPAAIPVVAGEAVLAAEVLAAEAAAAAAAEAASVAAAEAAAVAAAEQAAAAAATEAATTAAATEAATAAGTSSGLEALNLAQAQAGTGASSYTGAPSSFTGTPAYATPTPVAPTAPPPAPSTMLDYGMTRPAEMGGASGMTAPLDTTVPSEFGLSNQYGNYGLAKDVVSPASVQTATGQPGFFDKALNYIKDNKIASASMGLNALKAFNKKGPQEKEKYSGPLSRYEFDPDVYQPYEPEPPTPYQPKMYYAGGGPVEMMSNANIGVNPMMGEMAFAGGGISSLGEYSDYARGGRMLKGPGDGMSDNIPATIAGKQPARLANEEFVVPADVVSHLGNGSSEAGAKALYKMMDRVRQARTGNKKQGKQINPEKYLA